MKKVLIGLLILAVIVGAVWFFFIRGKSNGDAAYVFTTIERSDILNTVSSTGQLEPVGTVDIGTQVSGTVDRVLVDYNDKVKKGDLLVVIDTTVLATLRRDSKSSLQKAQAQFDLSKMDYDNEKALFEKNLSSEYAVQKAKVNYDINKASLDAAKTSLQRATQNLAYAFIRSPINGTVIDRNVESGQTVAASFSTPTLFIIAEDLSKMQILAKVDESDIGLIDTGMTVNFEVPAYPDRSFKGITTQIRLQPTVVSNVVNYTVVIEAPNSDDSLMPGMTATVDFIVQEVKDVTVVENAALSFQPPPEVLAEFRKNMASRRQDSTSGNRGGKTDSFAPGSTGTRPDSLSSRHYGATPDSLASRRPGNNTDSSSGSSGGFSRGNRPKNMAILWRLDKNGSLEPIMVKKGATDSKKTEVTALNGDSLEGIQVIVKANKTTSRTTNASSNPLMPTGPGGRH